MNAKTLWLGLGIVTCAAATAGWLITRGRRAETARAAEAQELETARTRERLRQIEGQIAAAARTKHELEAALVAARRTTREPSSAGNAPASSKTGSAARTGLSPEAAAYSAMVRENLNADPRLQALFLNSGRSRLASEHAMFYAAQRLSPQQIEQFETAMLKRQEQMMDLSAIAEARPKDERSTVVRLLQQAREEHDATLRTILGPDGTTALQEYQRTAPARLLVQQLAGTAAIEGEPLTLRQAGELTQILAQASGRTPSGGVDLRTLDWDAADASARAVLAPAQFELFQRSRTRSELQFDRAIKRALEREAARAGGGD